MRDVRLTLLIPLAFASCSVLAASDQSAEDKKTDAPKKAEQTHTPQPGTEQNPFVVKTIPAPKSQEETEHDAYEHHEKPNLDRWLTRGTLALVAVTGILAWFTFWLWSATRRLVIEAEKTAGRQLRAYVGIRPKPDTPAIGLQEMHTKGLRFVVVNDGQTPAYYVMNEIAIGGYTEDNPNLAACEFPEDGSRYVLNPGCQSDFSIAKKTPFTDSELDDIRAGKLKIFVWGEIRYRDAFGEDRFTKFRFRLGGSTLHWTAQGNEAN